MAIPSKRYDINSGETNVPVVDFIDINNEGPINTDVPTPIAPPVNKKYSIEKFSGALSLVNGKINNKTELTRNMIKALSGDNDVSNYLSKYITDSLSNGITQTYGMVNLSLPRSITGNRVLGRVPTTGCETDLNNLLRMLNRLGSDFNIALDLNGAVAGLMAILMKLICAGVPNAFSSITAGVPNLELLARAGAGMIIVASKNSAADVVIDIAKSNVGNRVSQYVPNITTVAINSLVDYHPDNTSIQEFSQSFTESLTILNPSWKGDVNNTTIVNIYNNGNELSRVITDGLLTQVGDISEGVTVTATDDVTLVSALSTITGKTKKTSVAIETMSDDEEKDQLKQYLLPTSNKDINLYNIALANARGKCVI